MLYDILIDYCSISFIFGKDYLPHLTGYAKYINSKNIDPLSVTGIISIDKESLRQQDYLEMFRATINYPGLKLGLTVGSSALTEQIAQALSNAVGIIEHLSAAEFDIEQSVSKIAFTTPVSTNYFGEMAKVRALRNLYFQLARAYMFDRFTPEDLHIQCISTAWGEEKYQPHANMLKSTTAAMAAILGGCDSLLVEPEDIENPLMRRIARNVSNILKEESYFNKTTDPVAGAHYLEVLTDKLSQKAWKMFQTIVNEKKEELHQ